MVPVLVRRDDDVDPRLAARRGDGADDVGDNRVDGLAAALGRTVDAAVDQHPPGAAAGAREAEQVAVAETVAIQARRDAGDVDAHVGSFAWSMANGSRRAIASASKYCARIVPVKALAANSRWRCSRSTLRMFLTMA